MGGVCCVCVTDLCVCDIRPRVCTAAVVYAYSMRVCICVCVFGCVCGFLIVCMS